MSTSISGSYFGTMNIASRTMHHRQLAPSASVRVSPLCLGAMTFGEAHKYRYGECSKETAFAIMDNFYSNGGNFIDTANGYQAGESEMWVGEWMKARDVRDEIVLATKYTTGYMNHEKGKIQANFGGNSTKSMKVSVAASLRKLQTTYIDILYVHWWDYTTTIPELMHSLNDLVVSGQVLYLGVSDTPAWVVAKANQYARDLGLRQFVVYQGMWNCAMRDFEREIIPMCKDEGMGLCPYGVLGQGQFQTESGFKEREKTQEGRKFFAKVGSYREVSKVLEKLANAKGKRGVTDIAMAYVMQKTPYVFPIVGGRKVEHIQGNVAALSVALTEDEVKEIEDAAPFDHGFPHTFLSGTLFDDQATPTPAQAPQDVFLLKPLGDFDWVEAPKPIKPSAQ